MNTTVSDTELGTGRRAAAPVIQSFLRVVLEFLSFTVLGNKIKQSKEGCES